MKSRVFGTAVVGLTGAIVGSFSMMLYASTHFVGVAGPGNNPPSVSAAPLPAGSSDQERIINAVKRVEPSVVALNVVVNGTRIVPADPFSAMFGGPSAGIRQRYQQKASGSGFIYSKSGLIVTNAHVVPKGTSSVEVVLANGEKRTAHVYSSDPSVDLALVKVDNIANLPPPVELGNSSSLQAGQWAIAIGEPFELKQTVTVGVVSGFNRDEQIGDDQGNPREFKGLLQTSAPINPGNSGGPLIDIEGRLIGVNQSTANPQAGAQGIGFAIPVNAARSSLAALEKTPGVTGVKNVSYIGFVPVPLNGDARTQLGYSGTGKVVIATVQGGSPADAAGIQPGDIVLKYNNKDVTSVEQLRAMIKSEKPGTSVGLQIFRQGAKSLVNVKIGSADPQDLLQAQPQQP